MRISSKFQNTPSSFVQPKAYNQYRNLEESSLSELPLIRQSRNGSKDKTATKKNITTVAWRDSNYQQKQHNSKEEDLQQEIEWTIDSIKRLSISQINIDEEFDTLCTELEEKKYRFERIKLNQGVLNNRLQVKSQNFETNMKVLKTNASLANAEVTLVKHQIEDFRRINMHYKRSNNKFLNRSVDLSRKSNRLETIQVAAHQNVHSLLVSYKKGIHESINLRKAIKTEFVHETYKTTTPMIIKPPLENYITKIEPYQLNQKKLQKHRISVTMGKNNYRKNVLINYTNRIQQLDHAFAEMKQNQAVDNLDELLTTFERFEARQDQINSKMFDLSNKTKRYETLNEINQREIVDLTEILEQIAIDTTTNRLDKQLYNRKIRNMYEKLTGEVVQTENSYLGCKDVLFNNFNFWDKSVIGKLTEMRKDLGEKAGPFFINLNTFEPILLLGWFEELLANMIVVKDNCKMKDQLNKNNESTALNSQVLDSSRDSPFASAIYNDSNIESDGVLQTDETFQYKKFNPKAMIRRGSYDMDGNKMIKRNNEASIKEHMIEIQTFDMPYDEKSHPDENHFLNNSELIDFSKIRDKNMNIIVEKQNKYYMDTLATKSIRTSKVVDFTQNQQKQYLSSNEGVDSQPSFLSSILMEK